jgi:outer membrane immunogenic protein
MRSGVAVAVVVLGLSGGVACAEELGQRVQSPLPVMPANPDWTGFYAGAQLGTESHSANYHIVGIPILAIPDTYTRIGGVSRVTGGVFVGYNYQLPGPFIVGVEGSRTFLRGQFQLNGPSIDLLQNVNRIDTFAGRFGFLVTPTTMAYGKAGVSRINLSGVENGLTGARFDKNLTGTTYGVGIESMITENLLVRLEADRTRANNDLVVNLGFDRYRPEMIQVMAGAAVKFNPGPPGSQTRFSWLPSLPAITRSWTSVYVGADIGKAGGLVDPNQLNGQLGPFSDMRTSHSFFAGGDLQLPAFLQVGPTFVVGAQYSKSWMKLGFDDPVGNGGINNIFRFASISNITAVTGRLGFLATPSTLVYGRAGPARIDFTASPDYFNVVNPASLAGRSKLRASQVGGGIETFVTDHVALRVEGLFTKANEDVVLNGIAPGDTRLRATVTTGTVGLLAKF